MRNLGNTLNPLNRLAGMGVMRFGRSTTSVQAATAKDQGNIEGHKAAAEAELGGVADLATVS
jgi:hypothetical protein